MPISFVGHQASVYSICAFDEHRFITGDGDARAVLWDVRQPERGRLLATAEAHVFSVEYLPEWRRLVMGTMYGGVHWVDLGNGQPIADVRQHEKGVYAMQRVGNRLYTGGGSGRLTAWNIETCRTIETLHLTNQSIRSIDYSPTRHELAIGCSDRQVYLLDAYSLTVKASWEAHANSVFAVKYHLDGKQLLTGGRDALLRSWPLPGDHSEATSVHSNPTHDLPAHWYTLNEITLSPDGQHIATASRDKTIRLWQADTFRLLGTLDLTRSGHTHSVNALLWLPGHLISVGDDRRVLAWQLGSDY